jgi:histidinol-phosphate aminotransferase
MVILFAGGLATVKDMAEFDPSLNRRDWLGAALGLGIATGLDSGAAARAMETPVRMNFNENPMGPSPRAIEAIRREFTSLTRYTAAKGDAFREQIAALERVAPEQIFIGELLEVFGLNLALLGPPGGEFLYSEPGYSALVDAVAPAGGKVVAVPLTARMEDDLPAIAAAVNAKTRAVYLVSPHNPSGTVSDKAALDAFIRDLSPRTLVMVDEAYLDFLDDYQDRTAARFIRQGANVVVFRTFGKMYGLAGLNIGYAIAPKALAKSLAANGLGSPFEVNNLAVAAASASMTDTQYVAAMRERTAQEREKWHALLDRLGVRHAAARAGFLFFETGRPHAEFAAAMLKKGVDVGRVFPPADRWTRLSFGTVEENAFARAAVESYFR